MWHNVTMRPFIPLLATGLAGFLAVSALAAQPRIEPSDGPIELSKPPVIQPESTPIKPNPGGGSTLSPDALSNSGDYMKYEPYNTFPRELDLWNLEGTRFVRGPAVISPDKSLFAYSEVIYIPNTRQTSSKLYLVPVPPPPTPDQEHLPSEDALHPEPPLDPLVFAERYDPAKTMRLRQTLLGVGYDQVKPFDFKTLTVVDWSASGQRLLFKEKSGVLHVGLRTSDLLVYDESKGTVTIYPEVSRILKNYWMTEGNLPNFESLSWDVEPLGWEPNSDSGVLLKAWAYDKKEKKFLGLWRYDVDAERAQLLSLNDNPIPVAANGWLASPLIQHPLPVQRHHKDEPWLYLK